MMTTQLSFIGKFPGLHPPPPSLSCRDGRHFFALISSSSSKNGDSSDDSDVRPPPSFVFRGPNPTLARYSGDWSRIEVISQETEELLAFARIGVISQETEELLAFAIAPICLVLLFSIPMESE